MPILGAIVSILSLAGVVWWALEQEPPTLPDTPARWAALAGAIALYARRDLVRGERWQALLRDDGAHPQAGRLHALNVGRLHGQQRPPGSRGRRVPRRADGAARGHGARTVVGTLVAERLLDIAVLVTAFLVLTFGVVGHAGLPRAAGCGSWRAPSSSRAIVGGGGDHRRCTAAATCAAVGVRRADDRGHARACAGATAPRCSA